MSLEFIARNGIISRGNIIVTGSLTTSGSTALTNIGSSTFTGGNYLFKGSTSGDGGIQIGTTINGYTGIDWISNNVGFGLIAGGGITVKVNAGVGLNIGTSALSNTSLGAMLGVKGSGTTSSTTSFLVQNSSANTAFTIKDDGYIRPYYGINFGSDSPSTGTGGLIYSYDSGVAIQSYGAGAGNSRYGRLEVGRVIPTSNFLGYFVGTTIGTNSTIFGATSDGGNTSTWFYFGNNLSNIVSSAIVNIDSTTRGFLLPRTNLTSNISTPAQGLQTYITASTTEGIYYYNSGSYQGWTRVLNDSGSQVISGSLSVVGTGSFTTPNGTITIQDRTDGINGTAPTISSTSTMRLGTTSTTLWVAGSTVLIGNSGNQLGITGDTITPNYDNSGALGTTAKYWGNAYINQLLVRTSARITGSLAISGSASTSSAALTVYKSGSTVLDVQGSQGSLMSIEDSLTGSLMSVGNISGLPLMEVFDDGTMNAGKFNVYPIRIVATGSQAIITGSLTGSFSGNIIATTFTASSALVTGNVTVLGTASINNLIINQIGYSSGSNQLGDAADDTQTFYGTVVIPTGSLTVTGSTSILGNISLPYGYRIEINGENFYSYAGLDFGGQIQINSRNNNSIFFSSNGIERMRIIGGASGNINIGPITPYHDPGYRLNISGSGTSGSLNAGDTLYVSGSRVGIRNTSPSASLHISGQTSSSLSSSLLVQDSGANIRLKVQDDGVILVGTGLSNTLGAIIKDSVYNTGLGIHGNDEIRLYSNNAIPFYTKYSSGTVPIKLAPYGNGVIISPNTLNAAAISDPTATLQVLGAGATSSTTAFLIQNSNASSSLQVKDDGSVIASNYLQFASDGAGNNYLYFFRNSANTWILGSAGVGNIFTIAGNSITLQQDTIIQRAGLTVSPTISTPSPLVVNHTWNEASTVFATLDINVTNTLSQTGSKLIDVAIANTSSFVLDRNFNLGIKTSNPSASLHVVGNTILSGSAGSGSALTVYKSGSTVLDVQGSSGQLFSVTDSLTGSLFSVNTVAGLPTIEAFSDNTVNIGKFNTYPIKVVATGSLANITGSFSGSLVGIATTASYVATASYTPTLQQVTTAGSSTSTPVTITGTSISEAGNVHFLTAGYGSSGQFQLRTAAGSVNAIRVTDTGLTGIGTTSPSAKLHVVGSGTTSSTTALLVENNTGTSMLRVRDDNAVFVDNLYVTTRIGNVITGLLQVGASPTISNNVYFNSTSGQVGIGTSTPSYKLDVSGSGNFTNGLTVTGSLALTGALTASSAVINGNVTVLGTASIAFLNVTYESASVIYSSGSNQLGDAVDDTQLLYGSVIIPTGSLVVTGSVNITGSAGAITVGRATSTVGLVHIQKPANSTLANLYLATPYPSTTPTSIIFQNNDFGGGATGTGSISWDVGGNYFNISNRTLLGDGQTSIDLTPGSTIGLSRVGAGDLQLNFLQGGVASYVIRNVSGQRALAFITDGVTTTTAEAARFTANSNFLVGTTSDVARVVVKGSGTTSSTTALLVQNSNASSSLQVRDDRSTLFANSSGVFNSSEAGTYFDSDGTLRIQRSINGTTYGLRVWNGAGWAGHNAIEALSYQFPIYGVQGSNGSESASPLSGGAAVHGKGGVGVYGRGVTPSGDVGSIGVMATTLYVKSDGDTTNYNRSAAAHIIGRTIINGNTEITGSLTVTTGSLIEFQVNQTGVKIGNATTDSHNITGSLAISASAGTGSALSVYKSGSTVFRVEGSQGELFAITDSLSGSLFSVSNVSGLPILEVFSDNTTLVGDYLAPALITTKKTTVNSGSTVIYNLPTASYDGGFFDYVIRSGSNARAGQIMSVWSGTSVNHTELVTSDFGNTNGFTFGSIVSGSNMALTSSASTSGWTLKTIIRSI